MAVSLVTGAGGFVGSNLVRALLIRGDIVHVFLRPGGDRWRLHDIQDKLIVHDIDLGHDFGSVKKAIFEIKPDYVFHLAHYGGNRGQTDGAVIRKVIIDGTAHIYDACKELGTVKAIINTGSSSEYGSKSEAMREDMMPEPNTEYGIAKLWATLYGEHLRREKSMPISTLRLFSVYGPYEAPTRLFPAVTLSLLANKAPKLAQPKTARDFIHVDDVVEAIMLAPKKPFGIYNIGTGIQTTLEEAVNMLQSEVGSSVLFSWGEDQGRGFDTQFWKSDTARMNSVFGWTPKISLKEGVQKTVAWFKEHTHLYE